MGVIQSSINQLFAQGAALGALTRIARNTTPVGQAKAQIREADKSAAAAKALRNQKFEGTPEEVAELQSMAQREAGRYEKKELEMRRKAALTHSSSENILRLTQNALGQRNRALQDLNAGSGMQHASRKFVNQMQQKDLYGALLKDLTSSDNSVDDYVEGFKQKLRRK